MRQSMAGLSQLNHKAHPKQAMQQQPKKSSAVMAKPTLEHRAAAATPKIGGRFEEDIVMSGWGFPAEGVYPYDIKSFAAAPVSYAASWAGIYPGTTLA